VKHVDGVAHDGDHHTGNRTDDRRQPDQTRFTGADQRAQTPWNLYSGCGFKRQGASPVEPW
jgi:hypothetical protein